MFSELIFVILAISVLLLIDNFSTIFALITCILLVYSYVYNFPYVLNKRVVVLVITKIWGVLLYCFRVGKQVVCLFQRHILFVKNNDPPPSHSSIQFCGDVASLENEINALVLNISRHYIRSWYDKISPNEEFSLYLNSSINQTLVNLCQDISKFDKKKFSYIILQVYLNFFSHFVEAKKKSDIFRKENFEMKHWATRDNLTEWCYLQSLVSTLLDSFCPSEPDRSLRSKHSPLLHTLVVEILTQNIIHPLVNLLCDPKFLNKIILKGLMNCTQTDEESNISFVNSPPIANTSASEESVGQPLILLPDEESSDDLVFQTCTEPQTPNRLSVPGESCQMKEGSPEFSMKTPSFEGVTGDFPCFVSSGIKSCSNINLSNHDFVDAQIPNYDSCISVHETTIKRSRSADFIRQMPQLKALNEKDYNIVVQGESNKMLVALKSELNSNASIEQAEEAIEVEVPTLFTDVQIVDTFQQNEAGILPYTLYYIQYTGIFHDTGKSSDVPHFVKQVVSIKRRFREFVALHTKLEDNPSLKAHLKGIKGPSKWLVLPFSNLDKRNIADRRVFLENYLRELCNSAAISQSSELQEFLAYGGGGERMTFMRKATDASVPRIDKMLVRGVRGAFDMFKTALPNSPLDEENGPRLSFEEPVPDQRFQEHLLDYSSREPEIKEHVRNFMENSSFGHTSGDVSCSEHGSKKSSLLRNTNFKTSESCQCSVLNENDFSQKENPFGNTVIELLAVALQLDETNLGYMFSVFKILCAPCINRFFVDTLDSISEEHLAIVLHLLHKLLWPEEECLKEQSINLDSELALNKIMECFKVVLEEKGVMLSKVFSLKNTVLEKINLFLSSIQCEEANRCLLFHMFDVVIETLCSEET